MKKIKIILLSLLVGSFSLLGVTSCFDTPNIDVPSKDEEDKPNNDDSNNNDKDDSIDDDFNHDNEDEDKEEIYSITLLSVEHGTIKCDKSEANEYDLIELYFYPESYKYYLSNVYINNRDCNLYYEKYINEVEDNKLSFGMIAGGISVSATFSKYDEYDAIKSDNDNYYDTLNDAINAKEDNLFVINNTSLNKDIIISNDMNVILDLNGNTLNCLEYSIYVFGSLTIMNGNINGFIEVGSKEEDSASSLILKDNVTINCSSEEDEIKNVITLNNKSNYLKIDETSTVNALEFSNGICINAGNVEVDGKITSEGGIGVYIAPMKEYTKYTDILFNEKSKVYSDIYAIFISGGQLTFGGKIKTNGYSYYECKNESILKNRVSFNVCPILDNVNNTNVTITSSAVIYNNSNPAMYVNGGIANISGKIINDLGLESALDIEGGIINFKGKITNKMISINKTENSISTPKLFVNDNASIYGILMNGGYLEVNGGKITDEGICVYGGECIINNGEINGRFRAYSERNYFQDDLNNHKFIYDINIVINGGFFIADYPVYVFNTNKNITINVAINNGTFISTSKYYNKILTIVEDEGNKVISKVNYLNVKYGIKTFIDGVSDYGSIEIYVNDLKVDGNFLSVNIGDKITFKFIPLDSNYKVKNLSINNEELKIEEIKDNTYTSILTHYGLYLRVQFCNINYSLNSIQNNGKFYDSIEEAINLGCTDLTLLSDNIIDKDLFITTEYLNKNIYINLNGHNIDIVDDTKIYIDKDCELYLKGMGTISGGNFKEEGSLINILCDSSGDSYDTKSIYSLRISEDISINIRSKDNIRTSAIKVMSDGTSKGTSYINISGIINVENGDGVIADESLSKIHYEDEVDTWLSFENAEITCENGTPIKVNGNCIVSIMNGIYKGSDSALEIHEGIASIRGGYLYSTASSFENKDGKVKGAGIVAYTTSNYTEISIYIDKWMYNSPTISGIKAIYARNIYNNSYLEFCLKTSKLISIEEAIDTDNNSYYTFYIIGADENGFIFSCTLKENSPSIYDFTVVNTYEEFKKALEDEFIERIYLNNDFTIDQNDQLIVKGKTKEIYGTNKEMSANKISEDDIHSLYVYNPVLIVADKCSFVNLNIININNSDSNLLDSSTVYIGKNAKSVSFDNVNISIDKNIKKDRVGIYVSSNNRSEYGLHIDIQNSNISTMSQDDSYGYAFYILSKSFIYMVDSVVKGYCIAYLGIDSFDSCFEAKNSTIYAKNNLNNDYNYGAFVLEYNFKNDDKKSYLNFYDSNIIVESSEGSNANYLINIVNDTSEENYINIDYEINCNSNLKCNYFSPNSEKFKNILLITKGKYIYDPTDFIDKNNYEVIKLNNDKDGYNYQVVRK